MEERKAKIYVLIGVNGSGKTTIQKEFLKANKRNLVLPSNQLDKAWFDYGELKLSRKSILDPDNANPNTKKYIWKHSVKGLNTFSGTKRIYLDGNEQAFDDIACSVKGFRKGGLFIDDFKTYVKSGGKLKNSQKQLFIDYRHREIDIFLAAHSFEDINSEIYSYGIKLLIFQTKKPPNKSVLEKITNVDEFLSTIKRVNYIARTKNKYYCESLDVNP